MKLKFVICYKIKFINLPFSRLIWPISSNKITQFMKSIFNNVKFFTSKAVLPIITNHSIFSAYASKPLFWFSPIKNVKTPLQGILDQKIAMVLYVFPYRYGYKTFSWYNRNYNYQNTLLLLLHLSFFAFQASNFSK